MDEQRAGEEFRNDLRPLQAAGESGPAAAASSVASVSAGAGSGNAQARRALNAQELAPLTQLSATRSLLAVAQTAGLIAAAALLAIVTWPSPWLLLSVVLMGIAQHGLFILAHEAAHYRLLPNRGLNDALGRVIGMAGGVSMCTYRVTHRLHHNNLYTEYDPDTAIHGGYPRGRWYLCKKLAQDLLGLNAWKTFAYFFGAPAINATTNREIRPLDDTSPELRAAARADRWAVLAFHLAAPLAALAFGGWQALLMYAVLWMLPLVTVLQPILRLRAICEHGAVTDLRSPLTAARSNNTAGGLANWLGRAVLFPHHVNYHLEHHLYPAVPHYHLPRLHRLLRDKEVLQGAEVRDIASTLNLIFAPRKPHA
ncbi:MAG: fatty acid desaturase family protein [Burkholderiales bacterium]